MKICCKFFDDVFILIIWLLLIVSVTHQQQCQLPDGKGTSTCIRLHYCDSFQKALKNYGASPPEDVRQNILAHACKYGLVCCPDNAIPAPLNINIESSSKGLPEKPNLAALKFHRNYNLINDKRCGSSNTNRIIGGTDADLFEIPWSVLLGYKLLDSMEWKCGGNLISRKFVLTAAHCITRELFMARLGEYQLDTNPDCDSFGSCADPVQDILVERKIKYPGYSPSKKTNDIALLKLKEEANIEWSNIRTICLPTESETDLSLIKKGKNFTIFGWGNIGTGNKISNILQKAYLPFVENEDCNAKFQQHFTIYPTQICAGGHSKIDSCKGDSGGGLTNVAKLKQSAKIVLYGIVSYGADCEDKNAILPGVYTNIQYYLNWILDSMS